MSLNYELCALQDDLGCVLELMENQVAAHEEGVSEEAENTEQK